MSRQEHEDLYRRTVNNWQEFEDNWGGLFNFLLADRLTQFRYQVPPLERIVEEVRHDPAAIVRGGIKGDVFDLSDIKEEFCRLPVSEAIRSRFVLAHFSLHPNLSGKGQVFEGIEEQWVEPWRQALRDHGFTFERAYAILFASGPHSASNYHIDRTHQLAWQQYGTKYFHALKDPNRWTTQEQRARCELVGMTKPAAIREEDTYVIEQPPGTALWNPVGIPHWVETLEDCAVTLTLVHTGLRHNGQLCELAEEREQWLQSNAAVSYAVA